MTNEESTVKTLASLSLKGAPNNITQYYALNEPRICPLCHYALKPSKLSNHLIESKGTKLIPALYLCDHCFQSFVTFSVVTDKYVRVNNEDVLDTELLYVGPQRFTEKSFDPMIKDLSPQFVKIYNQSLEAESMNLDEIAGIGYRKALEFLTKDFCIHLHPDKGQQIKETTLSNCIKTYIDDRKIKTFAEKAAWIGNDETHYVRKHNDRDISDMKKFIDAMVHVVSIELIFEDADSISPA